MIRFDWEAEQVAAEIDAVHRERFGLYGELSVASRRNGKPGLLYSGRFNTSSLDDRAKLVRYLSPKVPVELCDWSAALEQVCLVIHDVYRRGEPVTDLRMVKPLEQPRWLVEPFVSASGLSVLFADGGTGKSTLALACGLSLASGKTILGTPRTDPRPVLYVDFEDDKYTHAERLDALQRAYDLSDEQCQPIWHQRLYGALTDQIALIRRKVSETRPGLVVVDSFGMARGADPVDAESTIATNNALRSLALPILLIDHVPKAGPGEKPKPIGSVYTHNGARLIWYAEVVERDRESNEVILRLSLTKRNLGPGLRDRVYRVTYFMSDDDPEALEAIQIRRGEETDVPSLMERKPVSERILIELRRGARGAKDLAEDLGAEYNQVKARLWDLEKSGRVRKLADKRYGLA